LIKTYLKQKNRTVNKSASFASQTFANIYQVG